MPTSGTRGGNCHWQARVSHATTFVSAFSIKKHSLPLTIDTLMTRSSRNCTINANAFRWPCPDRLTRSMTKKITYESSIKLSFPYWPSSTSLLLANRLKINYSWFQTYALIPTYNQKLKYRVTFFYRYVIRTILNVLTWSTFQTTYVFTIMKRFYEIRKFVHRINLESFWEELSHASCTNFQ